MTKSFLSRLETRFGISSFPMRSKEPNGPFVSDMTRRRVFPHEGVASSLNELRTARDSETVWIPLEKIRSVTAASFLWEQSHFVRYLTDGYQSLLDFYDKHQPRCPLEFVFSYLSGVEPAPARFATDFRLWPWGSATGLLPRPEGNKNQWCGPAVKSFVDEQANRLDAIRESVAAHGFWQRQKDAIHYNLLIRDRNGDSSDYSIVLRNGAHRVAVLSYLEWPLIPMQQRASRSPSEIRISDLENWPGVLDESFSPEQAIAFFESFFRNPRERIVPCW